MSFAANQNLSSFLQRQEALFSSGRTLIAGQLHGVNLDYLLQNESNSILTADISIFNELIGLNDKATIELALQPSCGSKFNQAVIFVSKAKLETDFWLQSIVGSLKEDATIYLIGENKGGINAAPKLLSSICSYMNKVDSARHCSMYAGSFVAKMVKAFDLEKCYSPYQLSFANQAMSIFALPGVFSAAELDEGTALLLDTLPQLHGDVLDLGCGAGVIGSILKKQTPDLNITMADVSLLAVKSSQKTAEMNQIKVNILASDMFSNINDKFDFIISNPPFHAGLKTHYSATENLLRQASQFLKPSGELLIVANKFLRYEPILEEKFNHVEIMNQTHRFKIIRAK